MREAIRRVFGAELDAAGVVQRVLRDVREEGDTALRRYNEALDGVPSSVPLQVSKDEIQRAYSRVHKDVVSALQRAAERITAYHKVQLEYSLRSFDCEGIGQVVRPIERVGIYVPGTSVVYPSTVLMTAIPARVAGVGELIMTTPAAEDGRVSPLKLVAADIANVTAVYRGGGAQAIAAMAYGTETVPRVHKICGPGGIFPTLAKKSVYGEVGIDGVFGPSETVVIADEQARPELVAADLIAGAEHDQLATALLLTPSEDLAKAVDREVAGRLASLERRDVTAASLEARGGIALVESVEEAFALANEFAPEHLCLHLRDAGSHLSSVRNAGCVFVGETAVESIGDYTAGPSHVMPTAGSAVFASPLGVHDFLKVTSVVRLRQEDMDEVAPPAAAIARAEGLAGHAQAIDARMKTGR